MKNEVELLSPCGDFECVKAAVQNGADAIYVGASSFSARASAANFDLKELEEVINYAHIRNVKVHLALNTLIKNNEFSEAISLAEKKAEIVKCNQQLDMLVPWESFDIPLDFAGTEKTSAFVGALPGEWSLDKIYEALAEQLPVDVSIISHDKNQTCIMVICLKENRDGVNSALRGIGFAYPSVSVSATPAQQKENLNKEIEKLEGEIKTAMDELETMLRNSEHE